MGDLLPFCCTAPLLCVPPVNYQMRAPPEQGSLTLDREAGELVISSCALIPQHRCSRHRSRVTRHASLVMQSLLVSAWSHSNGSLMGRRVSSSFPMKCRDFSVASVPRLWVCPQAMTNLLFFPWVTAGQSPAVIHESEMVIPHRAMLPREGSCCTRCSARNFARRRYTCFRIRSYFSLLSFAEA